MCEEAPRHQSDVYNIYCQLFQPLQLISLHLGLAAIARYVEDVTELGNIYEFSDSCQPAPRFIDCDYSGNSNIGP